MIAGAGAPRASAQGTLQAGAGDADTGVWEDGWKADSS